MEKKKVSGIMLALILIGLLYTMLNMRLVESWSNGGYSSDPSNPDYGTHDWIAEHALDWLPIKEKQYILDNLAAYLYGTELPDNPIGDTALHHIYYWSNETMQDNASAVRAQTEYVQALAYIKSGNVAMAVKTLGIMSHYIVDVAVFGHVMADGTDWGPEIHHSVYESYVNNRTDSYDDDFNGYLSFDGNLTTISAYDAAKNLAYDTTFDVDGNLTCVWMDQNYDWNNSTFKSRAGESLNLAVNYLTDVLHTLYLDATPLLYIDPAEIEYWTPSHGETFTVRVKIDSVIYLYGYDFKLYWNTTLLDLVGVNVTAPWPQSGYIVAKNETNEASGLYWLVVAAYNVPSFNGSTTLARLTFKITYDPIYPENSTCTLDLADTKLSAPLGVPIDHMVQDGKYSIYSKKPKIKVESAIYTTHTLGETFTVNVTVSDIVYLYNFTFQLSYNTTLLDVVTLEIGSFLNSPRYVQKFITDDANGLVWLWVWSVSPAPPAKGSGVLARITFKVAKAAIWPDPSLSCTLDLHDTLLMTNTGVEVPHDVEDGEYIYEPKPGDLDSDGVVGLTDLRIVAYYYDPNYNIIADLNRDEVVDIYDLTIVSYYYGKDC